ncbi:SDR family oxidoreductase [Fodinicurvata sp. EGI_FJ10296]|uniref:SDR family oxidoreductase n=1 Tax=Fodinicurvata sp. EGI_FJ10296 TaxID=3231908 RepID=UPI0034521C75
MSRGSTPKFFCFGLGFSGVRVARRLRERGWPVGGSVRTEEKAERLRAEGIDAIVFTGDGLKPASDALVAAVAGADIVLQSAAPLESGDPALLAFADAPGGGNGIWAGKTWIGYLSTIGVYGDRKGEWTDETVPIAARSVRAKRRAAAEAAWTEAGRAAGVPVHIFRLPGIYGPGRSAIDQVEAGTARRIIKPNQVFNRIHVDDLADAVVASIDRPGIGPVFNLCDDEPSPSEQVIAEACRLLGVPIPEAVAFDDADMSPMARDFYSENKRISNARMKNLLDVTLAYPTYREGLRAILDERRKD